MISNHYRPSTGSNISYPDPTLDIVFDSKTAKLTLNGYIQAVQGCQENPLIGCIVALLFSSLYI